MAVAAKHRIGHNNRFVRHSAQQRFGVRGMKARRGLVEILSAAEDVGDVDSKPEDPVKRSKKASAKKGKKK